MFPGIFEFEWNAGHVIFLGIFYGVLTVVVATLIVASIRAARSSRSRHLEAVRWHADFEDLPREARHCRHELSGVVAERTCPNGFDCRSCPDYERLVATAPRREPLGAHVREEVAGFAVDSDRLYHRGHTWVARTDAGTLRIGLDDLGRRLLASLDRLELPSPGARLVVNGTAWTATVAGEAVRVLSPVEGEVVGVGGSDDDWYLEVRPPEGADLRHLLGFDEAKRWMLREADRFQLALAGEATGPALADGGAPVDDLAQAIPAGERGTVCGLMLLEP